MSKPEPEQDIPIPEDVKKEKGLWEKTRKSLIERLNNWEDQKTWNEFYQTYWRLIFSVGTKAGLTREEAFDVVQETVIAIARQVQKGQYDPRAGSFKAWLLQMTRWRILDVFRARKRQPSLADQGNADSEDTSGQVIDRLSQDKDNMLEKHLGPRMAGQHHRRRPRTCEGQGFASAISNF
jgi:RNA polymerase sigma factor (sigma-70 family)